MKITSEQVSTIARTLLEEPISLDTDMEVDVVKALRAAGLDVEDA